MPPHACEKEKEWGEFSEFKKRALCHILEAEEKGGQRERLTTVETKMKFIEGSGKWFLLAAFIGGLLSNAAPELIDLVIKCFLK